MCSGGPSSPPLHMYIENTMNASTLYVCPCPSTPGHVCLRNAYNERVDTCSGPRDFMIRTYLRAGHRIFDERGRELTLTEV